MYGVLEEPQHIYVLCNAIACFYRSKQLQYDKVFTDRDYKLKFKRRQRLYCMRVGTQKLLIMVSKI